MPTHATPGAGLPAELARHIDTQQPPDGPAADLRRHTEHLEDLLVCITTLAERLGDPFDLSDWPGDLGESAVRRALELEARLTIIGAVASVGPIQ